MGRKLTMRLTDSLEEWLERTSRRIGISVGRIVRERLERARLQSTSAEKAFLKLAGSFNGPGDFIGSQRVLTQVKDIADTDLLFPFLNSYQSL